MKPPVLRHIGRCQALYSSLFAVPKESDWRHWVEKISKECHDMNSWDGLVAVRVGLGWVGGRHGL